jgi:hypothetical protein
MSLPIPFLLRLLDRPLFRTLIKVIFYSQPNMFWQLIGGVWHFTYIRTTTRGLYVSLFHTITLSFLMSLIGDQLLFLIPQFMGREITLFERFSQYRDLTLLQWGTTVGLLILERFLPENGFFGTFFDRIGRIAGSVFQSRMFHRLPAAIQKADERLLLIGSLIAMQWTEIVDFLARELVRKRAVSRFRKKSLVIKISLLGAFVFALSRPSAVSQVFGAYPFPFAVLLLLVGHVVMFLMA